MFLIPRLLSYDRTKKACGLVVLFLIAFIVAFSYRGPQSSAIIASDQNKFKLSFQLQKSDEAKFSSTLEKLNLPQSVKQGIQFELDSTSSAKLAYASPIKAKITFGKDTINFKGTLTRNQNPSIAFENIKIPASSSAALMESDFRGFLKKNLNPGENLAFWIDKNVTSNLGEYLIVFGQNNDYAVIFKNGNINFADLKNIKNGLGESIAKEETAEGITLILLKIEGMEKTPAVFSQNGWNYFVSSAQSAKDLVSASQSGGQEVEFPALPQKENLSMVINFVNKNSVLPPYFFLPEENSKILGKITNFKFVLAGSSFSGSFSVK
ncbi:MAG: hypothetical protein Q7S45_03085 [Candidatus Curtissbacteria bacterium]|nr:hypothetical protein [Candidatus Curtissbacteria bacterium]